MIAEAKVNPFAVAALLGDAHFSADGLTIPDPAALLTACGADRSLLASLTLVQGGVQAAATGAIQDPAGNAIGAAAKPVNANAGGASGVIYAAFPDLEPIPAIAEKSAIFNTSAGPGRRVLHSFSPHLMGDPKEAGARLAAILSIADTYANALVAFNANAAALGADGKLLNLVPVSAAIFAQAFVNPAFADLSRNSPGHLDPSYTLTALGLAISEMSARGAVIPQLALYYYAADVFAAARTTLAAVTAP